jgi:hypothetical protein
VESTTTALGFDGILISSVIKLAQGVSRGTYSTLYVTLPMLYLWVQQSHTSPPSGQMAVSFQAAAIHSLAPPLILNRFVPHYSIR